MNLHIIRHLYRHLIKYFFSKIMFTLIVFKMLLFKVYIPGCKRVKFSLENQEKVLILFEFLAKLSLNKLRRYGKIFKGLWFFLAFSILEKLKNVEALNSFFFKICLALPSMENLKNTIFLESSNFVNFRQQ